MNNAKAVVVSYQYNSECTICLHLNLPARTLYEDNEIAKYLNMPVRELKKQMVAYGAENKKLGCYKKRLYFPNFEAASKFNDDFITAAILAAELTK